MCRSKPIGVSAAAVFPPDEAEIASVLSAFADPDQAAAELVRLANRNGGADNTAVVVVDISP